MGIEIPASALPVANLPVLEIKFLREMEDSRVVFGLFIEVSGWLIKKWNSHIRKRTIRFWQAWNTKPSKISKKGSLDYTSVTYGFNDRQAESKYAIEAQKNLTEIGW